MPPFFGWKDADKIAWIQDQCQRNVDNLSNVRREANRHLGNKKKAYLKAKFEKLETNSKIKNIRVLYRGISYFKRGYQPRTNVVKDENGDLVAVSYSIVAKCRNYLPQLLNVHGVNDIKHTVIYTAETLVSLAKCLWVWVGYRKARKSHITRYWSNPRTVK